MGMFNYRNYGNLKMFDLEESESKIIVVIILVLECFQLNLKYFRLSCMSSSVSDRG